MKGPFVYPVDSWCLCFNILIDLLLKCFKDILHSFHRWIKMRWALLILFWLGWIGMLAGAIAIIVQAPRCKPIPEMNWWNYGPLYQIGDVEAFTKSELEGRERNSVPNIKATQNWSCRKVGGAVKLFLGIGQFMCRSKLVCLFFFFYRSEHV